MVRINGPMDIFKLLNQNNCRECNEKTCLAFAVAVFKNRRQLSECPHLEDDVIERFGGETEKPNTVDEFMDEAVAQLKKRISEIDLAAAADRLHARYENQKLTVKVLGKDFSVDAQGRISTDIHVNPWIAVPVLNYILNGKGRPVSGNWVTFRDLENGRSRYALFHQRSEIPLKKVADTYPDLFADMLDIFDGKRIEGHVDSDISIVLHPLPLMPILVCYWEPEDGLESSLHLFLDQTAEENLDVDSIYTLCAGMVKMLEKLSLRHRYDQS